ncbi:hypothetical protein [Granulicella sp. dw_53]|uniref:hypothetical protein n=1 Tax=Granulicella sp. dw_53 TaxID=2719792 RepID=UPI001BD57955|nr:hypothetical protein [Granulicella sp. dw_53]
MAESVQTGLIQATQVARDTVLQQAPNGLHYASYGDTNIAAPDLARMVQAVPTTIAAALSRKAYYFVPLAMSETKPDPVADAKSEVMISSAYTPDLSEHAICHRNVNLGSSEGIFISTRLLGDRFALAFEFFINVGHAFVDAVGVPDSFTEAVWTQAVADVRGETSQDAWESRALSLPAASVDAKPRIDEKAKTNYIESAFSDAVAIYLLSLSVDFDYSELREREYPLLAPQPLAERLRLVAKLFPPNPTYEFAIRYRRRA